MKLTDILCKNAKYDHNELPNGKKHKLMDGGGLFLHVKPKGKYWHFKYRFNQKQKLISFGVYPEISLKDARAKRENARKLIDDGQDPSAVKQEEKQQAIMNLENSFQAIAKEWHENNITKWEAENAIRTWRRLENNIFPTLGKKPINEIKPSEILAAIRIMEQRGATYLSRKTVQTCSAVFRYAIAIDKADYNPAADLSDALKPHTAKNHPSIGAKELPAFYKKLDEVIAMPTNKLAIRLLLLTFLRQGELRQCKWEYIDFEAKELHVPAEIMKMKESHIVPLAPQALEVLKELHKTNGWSPYIFPSQSRRVHPYISENTINKIIHTMGYKGQMVAHGARSLASTILNGNGFNADVIERQLAHAERNKNRAAYNRAEYLPERHAMMQWWGAYLERAQNGGGNVVEGKFRKIEA
jgi:integrase